MKSFWRSMQLVVGASLMCLAEVIAMVVETTLYMPPNITPGKWFMTAVEHGGVWNTGAWYHGPFSMLACTTCLVLGAILALGAIRNVEWRKKK